MSSTGRKDQFTSPRNRIGRDGKERKMPKRQEPEVEIESPALSILTTNQNACNRIVARRV